MYSLDNVLQQRLDAFVGGERSESQLLQDLTGLCVTPNAAWEALALIDQYHRRGKLSAEIARAARHKIERRLFGIQEVDGAGESTLPAPQVRTADGYVPGMPAVPEPFVVVGMAALFGGVAKAPIAVMLMVVEMTGEFSMIVPAMAVVSEP